MAGMIAASSCMMMSDDSGPAPSCRRRISPSLRTIGAIVALRCRSEAFISNMRRNIELMAGSRTGGIADALSTGARGARSGATAAVPCVSEARVSSDVSGAEVNMRRHTASAVPHEFQRFRHYSGLIRVRGVRACSISAHQVSIVV